MEGEIKNKQNKSEKIISTISDPATQEKKTVELSPGNNESKKKFKSQKSILKKESRAYSGIPKNDKSLGIKWDNKAIDEQNAYRMRHRLSNVQRHKMKSLSRTKYNSAVIGVEDDEYLKNLIKVNQITVSDELIKNVIKILNEPKEVKKVRNHSTQLKVPFTFNLQSKAIRSAAENMHVFDDILDYETKITLQNTIINKFHKEVLGGNSE
jgi:hypothetical protein